MTAQRGDRAGFLSISIWGEGGRGGFLPTEAKKYFVFNNGDTEQRIKIPPPLVSGRIKKETAVQMLSWIGEVPGGLWGIVGTLFGVAQTLSGSLFNEAMYTTKAPLLASADELRSARWAKACA
jgi:hypothetical protein